MAPKKKAGAPAQSSKVPSARITKADKSAINKARYAANVKASKQIAAVTVEQAKAAGKKIAAGVQTTLLAPGGTSSYQRVAWTDNLDEALFVLICTGHSMREISEMENMPSLPQMLVWLGDEAHPFSKCRARGKELLVPLYEEMAQGIAMNSNLGKIVTEKQVLTKDGDVVDVKETRYVDNVERSKLALQGIQWTLSHLKPKKHGRNPDLTTGGANEQLKGLFDALKAGPVDPVS